jgi:cytidine deaminase
MAYKHSACILYNGDIVSAGVNFTIKDFSIHAERSAYFNMPKKFRNKENLDILVIRINKSKELLYSKPCKSCIEFLKKKNIRNIYYSGNDNKIIKENTKNISNNHISYGKRLKSEKSLC